MGNNYVGTEHLLLGLLIEGEGIAAHVLEDLGANLDKVRGEIERLLHESGLEEETKEYPEEADQDAPARPVLPRPDRARPEEPARPGDRAGHGDRAGRADPLPPDQEQPGAHRRAGRRQDRHRRGAGAGDRPRQHSRVADGQARAHPRHGRRWSPAPSTAASSRSGSRRSSTRSASPARSSSSSTSCIPWSARAPPRGPSTPPTSSSRRSPAARSSASAPQPSTSTASTSRRTRRWSGASSPSTSTSRPCRRPSTSCTGIRPLYEKHHRGQDHRRCAQGRRRALGALRQPTARCRTRPSTSSTRPAPGCA